MISYGADDDALQRRAALATGDPWPPIPGSSRKPKRWQGVAPVWVRRREEEEAQERLRVAPAEENQQQRQEQAPEQHAAATREKQSQHVGLKARMEALMMSQQQLGPPPPSRALPDLERAIADVGKTDATMEGHCAPEQLDFLRAYVAQHYAGCGKGIRMCQVGFNAGHSAVALLEHAPRGSTLLSLDLGKHGYTAVLERTVARIAKELGHAHLLLLGDSAEMLPRFRNIDFDLVFVDGSHTYAAVSTDLKNSHEVATGSTVVLLDHVFTNMPESQGPSRAWIEALRSGDFVQSGFHSCCSRHGIAIGTVKK
eukprot:gnl/TRDRNA2_/TRDRNA2_47647_c0_seq1.p1 gnl/TRDRNA2_/TRDRNA2_47647_c0~~gnl/TRDRNA2_/TRDRNA2_47647_c0_seq1.p1  ORF type:complete len:312 (-),score=64.36 gnl/TRDRNA2_/TRDRNA2_47647_c0_seq1:48-983(-)